MCLDPRTHTLEHLKDPLCSVDEVPVLRRRHYRCMFIKSWHSHLKHLIDKHFGFADENEFTLVTSVAVAGAMKRIDGTRRL